MIERRGQDVLVRPGGPARLDVRPPGSKSLTNRALVCAALADGTSVLRGVCEADDALAMIDGLRQLGIAIDRQRQPAVLHVHGCGGHIPADEADLNAGAAGTAMRFLTALVCLGQGHYRLDGSARMRQRPIGPLVDGLMALGAGIGYESTPGFPPVTVLAQGLSGGSVEFREPPSSQFLSAIFMVAPYCRRDVLVRIDGELPSRPYLEMTIELMNRLGVQVIPGDGSRWVVPSSQRYQAGDLEIEPDASAATYLWAAAAITGGRARVSGLTGGSLQGDVRFADVLTRMGCTFAGAGGGLVVQGPPGGRLRGVDVDLNAMPDAVQTLAVAALFAVSPTTIRNVANLRLKETDRLAALRTELSKFGAAAEFSDDGLRITPPASIEAGSEPIAVDTYEDHRMAMSFALAGLVLPRGVLIRNADCVAKSFPGFFDALAGGFH